MACHEVYSDELAGRKWGYALWSPDPVPREVQGHTNHQQLPVSLGDVGFVRDGGFTPLFNVHLPSDDPHQSRYLPDNCVHISKPRFIRDDWLKKGMRVSRRVRVGGMDINVPQGIAPLTGQFTTKVIPVGRIIIGGASLRGSFKYKEAHQDVKVEFGEGWISRRTVEQDPALPSKIANDILVSPGGTDITFDAVSEAYSKFGFKRLPHTIPHNESDRLNYVLPAALKFYFHLRRRPRRSTSVFTVVAVEFTELKEMPADEHSAPHWTFRPSRENLINGDNGIHLSISTVIERQYGIKITNISDSDLYPTLFYFDNSDFSIQSYFLPPPPTHGGIPAPPLRAGESLTIGYGSNGTPPFQYCLREGQNLDLGFFKLFLTSTYVDLSSIVQESPFIAEDRGGKALLDTGEDRTVAMPTNSPWFVHTIPIVQTRE